jgi:hypothetical protein
MSDGVPNGTGAKCSHADPTCADGSTFAMTFMLPLELADREVHPGVELAATI